MMRWLVISMVALAGQAAAAPLDAEVTERQTEARRLAGQAAAIVPLLGLTDLWDQIDHREALTSLLDEVRGDNRQLGEVRAHATFMRALLADRAGASPAGQELRVSLGLITDWWVVGPFDNEGRGGYARVYAPENVGFARGKTYEGKERAVAWRRLPQIINRQGLVPLDAVLRPEQYGVAYATTWVEVPRAVEAALHVGSSGAVKVWVNGKLAHAHEVYRPVYLDQDTAPVHLRKGWNRILVKLAAADTGWSFYFRLTTPSGAPLPFRNDGEDHGQVLAQDSKLRPTAAVDLAGMLRQAATAGNSAALRALGLYLHYMSPGDPNDKEALTILKQAASLDPSTTNYRLAALAASDSNEKRKLLEEALAQARLGKASQLEQARVLVELGEIYARAHRERRAEELWRTALAVQPDYFNATLLLADLTADRGLDAQAQVMLESLGTKNQVLTVERARAQLDERRGLRSQAEKRYQALHTASIDDLSTLRSLFALARGRGDVAAALSWSNEIIKTRPDVLSARLDRAELLENLGRYQEAHQVLAQALEICPEEPRILERDGYILHRLGRDDDALASLRRSLELKPQQPELRTYLREIEANHGSGGAKASDDLARTWAVPMERLLAQRIDAAQLAQGAPTKSDEARVLLDLTVTRVHPNGLSETFAQRTVEILDQRGVRSQDSADIRYTPSTQSVEVKAARVYKRSGQIIEAATETDHDVSEPWYGLYYDMRSQSIDFSNLEPGDVIDIEYLISDVGRRNLFADYFGDLHILQEDLPRLESTYVLITPKSRPFYFNQPRLAKLAFTEEERGEERIYTLRAHDVPKILGEPGMPGFTELAAYVHVSTYKTWPEVAAWYRGLLAGQLQPDEAIRQTVQDTVHGAADEREKIRRLYDWVVQKTRYVGLEFGIHGYKPYRVNQIFARKFGDCKDKAALLVTMLGEIGVEATMVLARTRRGGDIDPLPASLAPFDHAIVYVPKYNLFLDGTAEFSGSDELPAQDQDIPVLLVNGNGQAGQLTRTPLAPAEHNLVTRESRVTLDADGNAQVHLRTEVAGEAAHQWREHYQSPSERQQRFEKAENAMHPGSRAIAVRFVNLDLEHPVVVEAELRVPSWAQKRGAIFTMPALGREADLLRSYARLSQRSHDLLLAYPWQQNEKVRLTLPAGLKVKQWPQAKNLESPFGKFSLSASQQGREVTIQSTLTLERHRIQAADYPAFRRFCLDIDSAVSEQLVLEHE